MYLFLKINEEFKIKEFFRWNRNRKLENIFLFILNLQQHK
jgi:hypothetical protein